MDTDHGHTITTIQRKRERWNKKNRRNDKQTFIRFEVPIELNSFNLDSNNTWMLTTHHTALSTSSSVMSTWGMAFIRYSMLQCSELETFNAHKHIYLTTIKSTHNAYFTDWLAWLNHLFDIVRLICVVVLAIWTSIQFKSNS